jgi:V/A-type H+/Na+-transporting ATPase subunit F
MTQIAVLGSEQFTLGFRLAGVRGILNAVEVEDLERTALKVLQNPDVSILIMETKDVSRLDGRVRHELVSSVRPTLVAVGAEEDNTLREKIKQAVGVDLW